MPRPPSGRLVALFGTLALALGGVGARLVLLQVRDGRAYDSLAADQRVRRIALPAERGTIYDRSMHELALSLPAKAVYADPALVSDPVGSADRFIDEPKRTYPGDSLAAQVLGFVSVDGAGLAGLELQWNDVLAGRPGRMLVEQDPDGQSIPQGRLEVEEPRRGRDLVLTIDKDLQYFTERALAGAVEQNGALGGTVIVLE